MVAQPIEVDTRIVSATNRNLAEAMSQGLFREDLYYRLSEVAVDIPPLREREGDAALIAGVFLERLAQQSGHRETKKLSEDASSRRLKLQMARQCPGAGKSPQTRDPFDRRKVRDSRCARISRNR